MAGKMEKLNGSRCSFKLNGFVVSDIGLKRENNEDNYLLGSRFNEESEDRCQEVYNDYKKEEWNYFAVFDGMGGGEEGEWASLVAAQDIKKAISGLSLDVSPKQIDSYVRQGFLEANKEIVKESRRCAVFGTTGTVLVTDGWKFRLYHLGDSRAYLFRDGDLYQLTEDQTLAAMKIKMGFYESNDPQVEIDKHKLTEFIGCDMTMENLSPLESEWREWKDGDIILLCSDGLYDMCSDDEISFVLDQPNEPKKMANQLLTYALRNGGRDNITCVIVTAQTKQTDFTDDSTAKEEKIDIFDSIKFFDGQKNGWDSLD